MTTKAARRRKPATSDAENPEWTRADFDEPIPAWPITRTSRPRAVSRGAPRRRSDAHALGRAPAQ